jgi:hypothetical protein
MILRLAGAALIALFVALTMWIATETIKNFGIIGPIWVAPTVTATGVVVAAWAAVWQQYRIDRRERAQRLRKETAARALMSAALSEICVYAQDCAAKIATLYENVGTARSAWRSVPTARFPIEAIKMLRDCIEHTDGDAAAPIIALIKTLQIQHSRVRELFTKDADTVAYSYECNMYLSDAIEVHADASGLFYYARSQKPEAAVQSRDHLITASASSCKIIDYEFPEVFAYMKRKGLLSKDALG